MERKSNEAKRNEQKTKQKGKIRLLYLIVEAETHIILSVSL